MCACVCPPPPPPVHPQSTLFFHLAPSKPSIRFVTSDRVWFLRKQKRQQTHPFLHGVSVGSFSVGDRPGKSSLASLAAEPVLACISREIQSFSRVILVNPIARRFLIAPFALSEWVVGRLRSKRSRMIATVQCKSPGLAIAGRRRKLKLGLRAYANLSCCRTFLKRKGGLFKKAHELAVLCSVDVAVIIFGHNKKLYEFSSCDMHETLGRYQYVLLSLFPSRIYILPVSG